MTNIGLLYTKLRNNIGRDFSCNNCSQNCDQKYDRGRTWHWLTLRTGQLSLPSLRGGLISRTSHRCMVANGAVNYHCLSLATGRAENCWSTPQR